MKLPRGVVRRGGLSYGRIHTRGGEISFPLGNEGPGLAQKFYATRALVRAALANGLDRHDVKAAIREGTLHEIARVVPEAEPSISAEEGAKRWLRDRIDLEIEPRNAKCIRARTEQSLIPFLKGRTLQSLTRADCHAYLAHVRRGNPELMPATIGHYVRGMREMLNWCVDVELLQSNPWPERSIMPRVEKAPPDRLTDEEVAVLVALPEPWGFSMRLALNTGCRWRELVRLDRKDITPDGQLLVRKAKDKEFRSIPISRSLLAEIVARKGRLLVTREGKSYSEASAAGFAGTIRRLATKQIASLPLEDRKALGGLARFHVHQCRHSYACRYLEAGGVLVALQQILGHSTSRMTERYGRLGEKAIRADAAGVHAAWEQNSRFRPGIHPIEAVVTLQAKC